MGMSCCLIWELGAWRLIARCVFVLSRYCITFSVIPIVDTVILLGLHAYAYGAVMISIA